MVNYREENYIESDRMCHMGSQGCTGYTCTPKVDKHVWGQIKFTGDSCKCTPGRECTPRPSKEFNF